MLDDLKQQLTALSEQLADLTAALPSSGRVPHLIESRLAVDLDKITARLAKHTDAVVSTKAKK